MPSSELTSIIAGRHWAIILGDSVENFLIGGTGPAVIAELESHLMITIEVVYHDSENAPTTDETHDPVHRSWVPSANSGDTDFPIQNLPLGIFSVVDGKPRFGVAIGDAILGIGATLRAGFLSGTAAGDVVDIGTALPNDGSNRLEGFTVIAYDIARGSVAAYYPEANCLIPLSYNDKNSGTPSYKSVPVRITRRAA